MPLAQGFRLVGDVEAVAAAICRATVAYERGSDLRHWTFSSLEELLPELRELTWHHMLAGTLLVEGIKGVRGNRHRAVLPAKLPRLTPDWELSRLTRGSNDEFIDDRVRPAAERPVKKTWGKRPLDADVEAEMKRIAADYRPDAQPSEVEIRRQVAGEAWRRA